VFTVKQIRKDLTGKTFGKLTVLGLDRVENHKSYWLFECSCDNKTQKTLLSYNVTKGVTTSCGCAHKEKITKHGLWNSRLYKIYYNMMSRCYNPKSTGYEYYGARKITVCVDWYDNFENFSIWSLSNGYEDHLTIDRKDVYGDYRPDNCKWSTVKEQGFNRRDNRVVTINGITKTITEWANDSELSRSTINGRLNRGVSPDKLLDPKKYQ
jgi:hypothetical protein